MIKFLRDFVFLMLMLLPITWVAGSESSPANTDDPALRWVIGFSVVIYFMSLTLAIIGRRFKSRAMPRFGKKTK